jgi:hypothetical protein
MTKWFAYIVLVLMFTPCLSFAKEKNMPYNFFNKIDWRLPATGSLLTDTTTQKNARHLDQLEDKKKVKEVAKARRQPKPEKIMTDVPDAPKVKPKRQRRPQGLERPPEIPRRNGN